MEPHIISNKNNKSKRLNEQKSDDGWILQPSQGGKLQVHIQLPSKNIDELIKLMDYDTEKYCVFKEGFIGNIVKNNGYAVWAKPHYILLNPSSFKICEKAEENSCVSEVKLCQVSHIHIPNDWQNSPCFQVIGKERDQNGNQQVLAQMCASDYAASIGWQHSILSYHKCRAANYTH